MSNLSGDINYDQATSLRRMMGKSSDVATSMNTNQAIAALSEQTTSTSSGTLTLTITSGKGGVGKTSVAVNLAMALAKQGKKVLLFDADLGLANINVLLGVIPKYNLYHVIKGHKQLKDVVIETPEGVDIIAGASGYQQLANMGDDERDKIIEAFDQVSGYDILLIDTGAGVSSNVIGFTLPADEVIVVTTPEPTSITDAYGIIKSIVLIDPSKSIKLLVNRVNSSLEGRKVAERLINITHQFLNIEIENCGFIFDDDNVSKSVRKQKPFYIAFPKSKASSCLNVVASRLLNNEVKVAEGSTGLGSFFKKMFQTQESD